MAPRDHKHPPTALGAVGNALGLSLPHVLRLVRARLSYERRHAPLALFRSRSSRCRDELELEVSAAGEPHAAPRAPHTPRVPLFHGHTTAVKRASNAARWHCVTAPSWPFIVRPCRMTLCRACRSKEDRYCNPLSLLFVHPVSSAVFSKERKPRARRRRPVVMSLLP